MAKPRAVRLADDVDAWVERYAAERGVTSSELLKEAVATFKGDVEAGVPRIREAVARQRREAMPGDCLCPVFEDGVRGFRQRCPVHGFGDASLEERRLHFAEATSGRAELFSQLRAPASTRKWGSEKKP